MEESRVETELPSKMADLGLKELDESPGEDQEKSETPEIATRVLRKRKFISSQITKSVSSENMKSYDRRVSMKPQKRIMSENANPKEIEAIYLNKKVKNISQTLETIYEEPKVGSANDTLTVGARKVKRLLTFHPGCKYTKEKIKKRRAKIKKLLGNKSFLNRKKIPMNVFLQSIECLELDEVVKTDVTSITIPNEFV